MGRFRDQMEEEMLLRGFEFQTRKAYRIAMRGFVVFCGKAPDLVGCAELRAYLLALIAKGRAATTVNAYSAAVRFFYEHVLRKPIDGKLLPYCKVPVKLPEVLAPSEVAQILDVSAQNLKHWTILSTSYGTGMRLAEVRVLRIADIDSERMTLRVAHGKGGRDRYVMLPVGLLELLRKYYRLYRPDDWLFPGKIPGNPLSSTTFQRVFHKARKAAGITKKVSLHSLRHAFATHLLEGGTNLMVIQRLLGHKRLSTTQVYLHLAKDAAEKTISPLDRLPSLQKARLKRSKTPKVKPSH